MNPDMARLCDAVEIVCDHLGMPTSTEDQEAIVFGVLTALREPSDDTLDAAADAATGGAHKSVNSRLLAMSKRGLSKEVGLAPVEWLKPSLQAMIDHVLTAKVYPPRP